MSKKSNSVVPALNKVLAETFSLSVNTQACHWNVTGPHFAELHTLFEGQYTELNTALDEIAERLRALEAAAPSGVKDMLAESALKDGIGKGKAEGMLANLLAAHEGIIKTIEKAIEYADAADDEGTEDLLIGRLKAHQKTAWMLRAQLS